MLQFSSGRMSNPREDWSIQMKCRPGFEVGVRELSFSHFLSGILFIVWCSYGQWVLPYWFANLFPRVLTWKASPNCHSIQILVLTPQDHAGSWFKPYTLISNLAVVMALIWYRLEGGVRRLLSKPIHAKEAGNSLPLFYSRVQTRLHLLGEPPVILKDIARKLMTSWSWSLTLQIIGSSIHTEEFACRSWLPAVLSPIDGICDGICDDIAQTFFVFLDWANSLP